MPDAATIIQFLAPCRWCLVPQPARTNTFRGQLSMVEITLNNGGSTLIDDADLAAVLEWRWYRKKEGKTNVYYAYRVERPRIKLHRFLLNAPEGIKVDHRDGNGLNNQRSNLRFCDDSQNCQNHAIQKNNTSGVTGVCWYKKDRLWVSKINCRRRTYFLGSFKNKSDAISARMFAEELIFGEFRRVA